MKKVLVFFGGVSCEHDISVITGVMALNALKGSDYVPIPVYITKEGEWYSGEKLFDMSSYNTFTVKGLEKVTLLPNSQTLYSVKKNRIKEIAKADAGLNCLHGLNGEDGSLAGFLQLSSVPITSSPIFSASASMDKYYTKIVLSGLDVPYLPFVRICRQTYERHRQFALKFIKSRIGYPLIIKPANLGSSIGITKVGDENELLPALDTAFRYDGKVIAEKALDDFREINCACYKLGDRYFVSECEEPLNGGKILKFDDKYKLDVKKKFPADINKKVSDEIRRTVKYVYRKLDFKGVVRMDFLVKGEKVYLNEINSVPGSLAYYLFCESTEQLGEFLGKLIEDAIDGFIEFKSNDFGYKSDVLDFGKSIKHK